MSLFYKNVGKGPAIIRR